MLDIPSIKWHDNSSNLRSQIRRAPFGYPGSKYRSADVILRILPVRNGYIEVFGGSGVILLNRPKCRMEVFNDRFSGVTNFYMCMQDPETYQRLLAKIHNTVHSFEYWKWCQETWYEQTDVLNRAYRWFYMTQYSFGKMGRNFARTTKGNNGDSGKILNGITGWQVIHDRLKRVCIDNLDWSDCMRTYDQPDAVMYLDPPYLETDGSIYKGDFTLDTHKRMCDQIFKSKSHVALSGYWKDDHIYNNYPWTEVHKWDSEFIMDQSKRTVTTEALWVKEASE